jgi:hypothetical protein
MKSVVGQSFRLMLASASAWAWGAPPRGTGGRPLGSLRAARAASTQQPRAEVVAMRRAAAKTTSLTRNTRATIACAASCRGGVGRPRESSPKGGGGGARYRRRL